MTYLFRMTECQTPGPASRVRSTLRVLTIVSALAYPLALIGVIVAFRYIGERWWVTLAAMWGSGGAHFVRYTVSTHLGLADVFNLHSASPRQGLEEVRGNGLREEMTSGRLFAGKASEVVESNAYRRQRQVEALTAVATTSPRPVIIAGDTNLPGLSWILAERLGHFRDAFSQAGRGFGYTFPANRPWMRIDRILTNHRLRALDFRVGDAVISDHRCVFAIVAADQ